MKMRSDSPFAALTEEEQMLVLDIAESCTIEELGDEMQHIRPGLDFSISALRRFVHRLREELMREEVEESGEAMEALAKAGRSDRARDGVLEAMRRKMFTEALAAKSSMPAMSVFRMMKEEKKEDRALAIEERRMALEEANAKKEWCRQELEDARSALRLLPTLTQILMEEGEGTAEERLAKARECLGEGGAKLLVERTED